MEQVQQSLARLAVAKAIKTPDNESEEDPWNKSVIFHQPFIKDLQKQKYRLSRLSEMKPQVENNRRNPQHMDQHTSSRIYKYKHSTGSSSGSGSSLTLDRRPAPPKSRRPSQRVCLPSDSEGSDEEEEDNEQDNETDDDSEVFNVTNKETGKPSPSKQEANVRPSSAESTRNESGVSSPSRDSTSSNVTPLTEDDEIEDPAIRRNSHNSIPQHFMNEEYYNYIPSPHQMSKRVPSTIDPLHYQRLQQYQNQIYYQQQLQYQQQLYLLSQNPSVFFPPGARVMDEPVSMNMAVPAPPPPPPHMSAKKSHNRKNRASRMMNSTDIRRRNDILRNSSIELAPSMNRYSMIMPMTPPPNRGRPSYF